MSDQRSERIRDLNDIFRKSFSRDVVITQGVAALASDVRAMVIRKVVTFDAFTPDNDPHGEHDFGSFEVGGCKFFWKIDYYDPQLQYGSDDPADAMKTCRVLTIMLAEEY